MCERCNGQETELAEGDVPAMLIETTQAALQCALMQGRGWTMAAQGLWSDMLAKWGTGALIRMTYVWGSALAILPHPEEVPELGELARDYLTENLEGAERAAALAQSDQILACMNELREAASASNLDAVAEAVSRARGGLGKNVVHLMMVVAGLRLHNAHAKDLEMESDLLHAQLNADLPQDDDEEEGEA